MLALAKVIVSKLVFLCETRQVSAKIEKMKSGLGMKSFHGVGSDDISGGLALFWDESLQVDVFFCLEHHACIPLTSGCGEIAGHNTHYIR